MKGIFRSPYPRLHIPEVAFAPFLLERIESFGDKSAFIDGDNGRVYTYSEVVSRVRSVASGLYEFGLEKGDVLAIYCPNTPEYAIAFLAVSLLGGVTTTINPLFTSEELCTQLNDSGAKFLLTIPPLMEKAKKASDGANIGEILTIENSSGMTSLETLAQSSSPFPEVSVDPQDVVAMPYSSGTTGFPKGVMLTHSNLVSNVLQIAATGVVHSTDRMICVLPMFHIYGLVVIMSEGLYLGATIVTMQRFDLEHMLGNIQKYRISLGPFVPPIVLALAKDPVVGKYDLSSMKTIFSAAAPLRKNVVDACSQRIGCWIKQGYGMTEASPATHMTPDDPTQTKVGSVGVLVPNSECRIVDVSSGKNLSTRQEGEIWIRGPQIMKGYLNRAQATSLSIQKGGWLRTGDIGYVDEDGHFFIVDRLKELIKYKGFQIAPAELEAVLLSHPRISDAAVIPVPDDEAGEIPKAFVVIKDGISAEEILNYVSDRVSPYKKIRKIEITDKIPKSPSGKILRRLLIERERRGAH